MNQRKAPGSVASSFTRQLQEVGMYRDTTLNGATRAKEVTKLRATKEKERALRAKQQLQKRQRRERIKLANSLKLKLRQLDRQQRRVNLLSKVTSAKLIQNCWRQYASWKAACVLKLLYDSAVVLQKYCRRRQAKHLLVKLKRENLRRAAILVQSSYRAYVATRKVARLRQARLQAAVVLQSHVRSRRARKTRAALVRSAGALDIQRVWRGLLSRRRVELLIIKELEAVCQRGEEKRMLEEDMYSKQCEDEFKKIEVERERVERERREIKLAQEEAAKKHGIPMLPWRRRTSSFAQLVQKQHRERSLRERKEERLREQREQEEKLQKQRKLDELEKHRAMMLKQSKRKSRELRAYRRRIETERKQLEELEKKKRDSLRQIQQREEHRMNAKRRARLLSLSKRRQERERQEAEEQRKREVEKEQRRLEQLKSMEQKRMEAIRQAAEETRRLQIEEKRKQAEEEKLRQLANQEAEERRKREENLRKVRLRERIERQKEKDRQRAAKLEKQILQEQAKRREEGKKKAIQLRRKIVENLAREERAKEHTFQAFSVPRLKAKTTKIKSSISKSLPTPRKATKKPAKESSSTPSVSSNNIDESIESIFRRAEEILLPRLHPTKVRVETGVEPRDEALSVASSLTRKKKRRKTQKIDGTLARALEWKLKEMQLHQSPRQQEGLAPEASLIEIQNPMLAVKDSDFHLEPSVEYDHSSAEEYSEDSDFERDS